MLDERWDDTEAAVADALRTLLTKECTTDAVRRAEEASDGRDHDLERRLADFGLWDLPSSPGTLAAVAWELGRALAPVPFPEVAPVSVVLGRPGCAWVEREWAPTGVGEVATLDGRGFVVRAELGESRRSTAGDSLRRVAPGGMVLGPPEAAERIGRLVRLLSAARLVGAAGGVLELGIEYSKRRVQFGRPIGAFQAVAHRLVDAAVAVESAGLVVRKAAWTAASTQGGDGAPRPDFCAMARALAAEAAAQAAATTHQVMGGFGFAMEEDCQLYSRRIRSWSLRLPPPGPELANLARQALDPTGREKLAWLWHHDRGLPLPRWVAETDRPALTDDLLSEPS